MEYSAVESKETPEAKVHSLVRRNPLASLWILPPLFLGALLIGLGLSTWAGSWELLTAAPREEPLGAGEIHVFYNIFRGEGPEAMAQAHAVISEQQAALRESGVEQAAAAVHYTVLGAQWEELVLEPTAVYRKTSSSGPQGSEGLTLQLLWEHCTRAPSDKVLYIHSKGSYHIWPENELFRKALMQGVLHPCCLEAIQGRELKNGVGVDGQTRSFEDMGSGAHDVCGLRYSPLPHVHFPGNMWWARCDYVRRLIPPVQFQAEMENVARSAYRADPSAWNESMHAWRGIQRYALEHWVGSHPSLRAVDTLPVGSSPGNLTYTSGYFFLPNSSAQPWKPVCARAPRAEIPQDIFLGEYHFDKSALPSLRWKEYDDLYGTAWLPFLGRKVSPDPRSPTSSACMFYVRLASFLQDAQNVPLRSLVENEPSSSWFAKDWLQDYTKENVRLRCQS